MFDNDQIRNRNTPEHKHGKQQQHATKRHKRHEQQWAYGELVSSDRQRRDTHLGGGQEEVGDGHLQEDDHQRPDRSHTEAVPADGQRWVIE